MRYQVTTYGVGSSTPAVRVFNSPEELSAWFSQWQKADDDRVSFTVVTLPREGPTFDQRLRGVFDSFAITDVYPYPDSLLEAIKEAIASDKAIQR